MATRGFGDKNVIAESKSILELSMMKNGLLYQGYLEARESVRLHVKE